MIGLSTIPAILVIFKGWETLIAKGREMYLSIFFIVATHILQDVNALTRD